MTVGFATLGRSAAPLVCVLGVVSSGAVAESADVAHDLEGVWKLVATRGQVGICGTGTIESGTGRIKRGRVSTSRGTVRIERDDDGSTWRLKFLQPDGSVGAPARKWTAEVRPDGSVVSSQSSMALCSDEPPRWYELELEGKLKARKRLRIELRGRDEPCPEMGCAFKVTYELTREAPRDR